MKINLVLLAAVVTYLSLAQGSANAAMLSGSVNFTPPAPSNLTTMGGVSWAIWNTGVTATSAISATNKMAGGPTLASQPGFISAITAAGTGATQVRGVGSLTQTFSYTNGNSPVSITNVTQGGAIQTLLNSTGHGVQLNVTGNPLQPLTVQVWGIGSNRTGTMTATLNGAPPVSLVSQTYPSTPRPANLFSFTFQPDAIADTLNITFLLDSGGGSNSFVGIQAVAVAVPEPSTFALGGLGSLGLLGLARRKLRRQ